MRSVVKRVHLCNEIRCICSNQSYAVDFWSTSDCSSCCLIMGAVGQLTWKLALEATEHLSMDFLSESPEVICSSHESFQPEGLSWRPVLEQPKQIKIILGYQKNINAPWNLDDITEALTQQCWEDLPDALRLKAEPASPYKLQIAVGKQHDGDTFFVIQRVNFSTKLSKHKEIQEALCHSLQDRYVIADSHGRPARWAQHPGLGLGQH